MESGTDWTVRKRPDISALSRKYAIRVLSEADTASVFALCRENRLYYEYCPPFVTPESIRADMHALPPGKGPEDKYYCGFFDGEQLIAVLDLICGYPGADSAFIGFFMTAVPYQHRGISAGIIAELCEGLAEQGFAEIRLGWVKGNPQASSFWKRNGFTETGLSYDTSLYTVTVARRALRVGPDQ